MKRVKYISRFAKSFTIAEIDKLAKTSARSNKRNDITGVLMASGDLFFQIIEGPDAAIDRLIKRIMKDPRHKEVLILNAEHGNIKRVFPDWSMKQVDLSDQASTKNASLKAIMETVFIQQRLVKNLTKTLEQSIWQQLAGKDC